MFSFSGKRIGIDLGTPYNAYLARGAYTGQAANLERSICVFFLG